MILTRAEQSKLKLAKYHIDKAADIFQTVGHSQQGERYKQGFKFFSLCDACWRLDFRVCNLKIKEMV